ncbi:hypothetical protein C9374_000316 [Naegleria lovaniensis]|uniref:Uncharacterized protein n=1 Tax=Naegleria lovaniensis TaxID=51637 RepID=A0AA88GXH3_NAELO|nr:uncharacterized protein C9374_000316 [Naegleria lovaniensis]KAG2388877.1 hypothetical protein C9374_000316 [Naegleria lovaniensis]
MKTCARRYISILKKSKNGHGLDKYLSSSSLSGNTPLLLNTTCLRVKSHSAAMKSSNTLSSNPSVSSNNPNSDYKTQYEKHSKDVAQKIVDLFHSNNSCQLSTFGGAETESLDHVKTSVLPMAVVKKQVSNIYLEEFKSKKKVSPQGADPLEGIKYYEDLDFYGFDDDGNILKNWDLYLCMPESSEHLKNLSHCPEPFQLRRKLNADESAMVSVATGHTDQAISSMFRKIERFPPRAVLSCTLEYIPEDSNAFHQIWTEQFRMHPNVSVQMKKKNARIFKIKVVKSAFHVEVGNEMKQVESLDHLTDQVLPDPLASTPNIRAIISRLNGNPQRIVSMLEKGYGLNLSDFFIFHIDSYCIKIMGRDSSFGAKKDPSQFSVYELDFGYRITSEAMLNQYLARFQMY